LNFATFSKDFMKMKTARRGKYVDLRESIRKLEEIV
jgi:hypothetical protein